VLAFVALCLSANMTTVSIRADEPPAASKHAPRKAPTPAEQKALDEFHKLYRLDNNDQIIKFIKGPFVEGRVLDRKYRWKDRFGNADHGQDNTLVYCYTFFERNGRLDPPHNFGMGSRFPNPNDNGGELDVLLRMVLGIRGLQFDDPAKLLKRKIVGDFIIRPDTPVDKLLAAVEQLLKNDLGLAVTLERRDVEETIVAVQGKIKPPFEIKLETPLELYGATLQPGKGEKDQGTYQEFLADVGRFIEPNRQVVSEVQNPPAGKMSWHRNVRTRFDDKTLHEDREASSVLSHLEEQTGLAFILENRQIPTIVVRRSAAAETAKEPAQNVPAKPAGNRTGQAAADPSLHDLIQQMATYEQAYFPFDLQVIETFRFPDDLTPQERAQNSRADGRKHQRLMEYAQLAPRIWRNKETELIDNEENQSHQQFSDGERIVSVTPNPLVIDGVRTLQYHVNNKQNAIFTYLFTRPLNGVFCLSTYGASELFSKVFQEDEEAVELAWDEGDAKLTFVHGHPKMKSRFVLWLSRAHAWHPIRLQRFMDLDAKQFFDEWEATKFIQEGKLWRVVEGTHRYRDYREQKQPDAKVKYSLDFKILTAKYGSDVDKKQFQFEIPAGATVREDQKPNAEPPLPTKTREVTVTVVDVNGKPIPKASVRLPVSPLRDLDVIATNEQGIARSAKAAAGDQSIAIAAVGFRPVRWIMGDVNELRAILVPVSPGVTVDTQGKPIADAWITNETISFRADGFANVPVGDWSRKDKDWSTADGRFELKANLTLRRSSGSVPYIAINPERDKMAIRFVPVAELGEEQKLGLLPVCHVHGDCLLSDMKELVPVSSSVETADDELIGYVTHRRTLVPGGLRVDLDLQLPAGSYVVKCAQTSQRAGFEIPFTIAADQTELDLGSKTVTPAGLVALKGKPAPKLDVRWRPEHETSWDGLRGQVVILDFWGAWCVPCVAAMPALMEIHDQFRDKPVRWIAIHTPEHKTFEDLDGQLTKLRDSAWNKRELPFTTVLDEPVADEKYSGKTSQAFRVTEWPTLIVIDQQGNVVGPVARTKLAETITRLLERDTAK
jgi:thiol-disulfide isomerase/thioredoxin